VDEAVGLQRAQVVVDLLAREPHLRGQCGRRAGLAQRGEQLGPAGVQRHDGGGGVIDDFDVDHTSEH